MPLYEYLCMECGKSFELLVLGNSETPRCKDCGSDRLQKLLSAHSGASGPVSGGRLPGAGDTTCCGASPDHAGCAGPGSCCGRG
ncbi:MAG: zinc ribbon domain-containing protein [Desulfobacterales bacterium]|nr:zinc ribbon domain-containing protein [Desulfobacterales bacterium]